MTPSCKFEGKERPLRIWGRMVCTVKKIEHFDVCKTCGLTWVQREDNDDWNEEDLDDDTHPLISGTKKCVCGVLRTPGNTFTVPWLIGEFQKRTLNIHLVDEQGRVVRKAEHRFPRIAADGSIYCEPSDGTIYEGQALLPAVVIGKQDTEISWFPKDNYSFFIMVKGMETIDYIWRKGGYR